jgi:hypothetical protein
MNDFTSVCREVAVKLLDSATVNGPCCAAAGEAQRVEPKLKKTLDTTAIPDTLIITNSSGLWCII